MPYIIEKHGSGGILCICPLHCLAYFLFKHSDMCKQIKDLHSLVYVTLLFMYLCITYVTHKDAILDVKVQVPCNGLLRSNFSEKEEATWIKTGEDYNFIQLEDWVSLALFLWLVAWSGRQARQQRHNYVGLVLAGGQRAALATCSWSSSSSSQHTGYETPMMR